MAIVIFYEKPGCATNLRQRRLLTKSGHLLVTRDLLAEAWTPERLPRFFDGLPVASWFNTAAPRVKSGAIRPDALDKDSALAAMIADPLLIRRPLMDIEGQALCGFDAARLHALIGLDIKADDPDSLDGCAFPHRATPCPRPAANKEPCL